MVVALIRAATEGSDDLMRALISAGAGIVVTALIGYAIWRSMRLPKEPDDAEQPGKPFDAMAGGFPVPPLPSQRIDGPKISPPQRSKEKTDA